MKTKQMTPAILAARSHALLAILVALAGCATTGTDRQTAASPIVRQLVKSSKSWNGAALVAYPAGEPEITILEIVIPPGARLPVHRHPVINAAVVLSGELTVVTMDGGSLRLRAGDPIVEVVNTPHYGINEGIIPAKLVVFYAGSKGGPVTVAEAKNE